MNLLDTRTVLFSYVISNAICAAVMTSLWWQNRRRSPELAFWLVDFVMQFIAIVLLILRGSLPNILSMVLSNALVIGGTLLLYIGLERYTKKSSPQWPNYLYLAGFVIVQMYFVYIRPSLPARTINVSLGLLVMCSQIAWLLLRRADTAMRPATRAVGLVLGIFSLVSLVRIILDLSVPSGNDLFKTGLYNTLGILIYQMLYIGLTFTLVLMVNRRLFTALENDISERKLAEEALKKSEEKFFIAFQNIPDGLVITSLSEGEIIEANESFFRITGFSREESLGRTTMDLALWGDLTQRNQLVDVLEKQGRHQYFETCLRRKSGEFFTGLISSELIQIQDITCILNIIQDITDRKQAENALRESERKYRLLFDELLSGFAVHEIICDSSGKPVDYRFIAVNAAFEKMTGLKASAILGKTVLQVLPGTEAYLIERYGQVALTREPVQFDNYAIELGKYFEVRAYSPEPGIFAAVFNDVTERKQAEEKLSRTLERLNLATRAARLGIWDWDIKKNELLWDERMYDLYGIRKDDFNEVYEAWLNGLHPDDRAMSDEISRQAQRGEREYDTEFRVIWPDGSVHFLKALGQFIRDNDGTPLRLTGVNYDITESKWAEEALRESEARFRVIFERANDAIHVDNINDKIIQVNQRMCEMMGYSREELLEMHVFDLQAPEVRGTPGKVIRDELAHYEKSTFEGLNLHRSGRRIPVEITVSRFESAQGDLVVSIERDVTERKKADEILKSYSMHLEAEVAQRTQELRDAQEKIIRQERLAMLGQVAGSIGHELRNPLGIISNVVYLLKMAQPDANETIRDYLNMIENETRTSVRIINDLLDFARLKPVNWEKTGVPEIVRQTLERFPVQSCVEVLLELPSDLQSVCVDPHQIVQVLGNLITNAYQAMPEGGTLTISAHQVEAVDADGQMMAISVTDTGIGIPKEYMNKLFEPLFTTKPKGIGLGLAVSQKLVEANGGRIEVISEPDRGSTFTVYLSLYKELEGT